MAKLPNNVTLTVRQANSEKKLVIVMGEFHGRIPIWMKMGEIPES